MTLKSMTGFARMDGQNDLCAWSWEIKSVNSKGLDVRCRYASGFEDLDVLVRERISKTLKRGNVTVGLTVDWQKTTGGVQINNDVLNVVLAALPEIEGRLPNAAPSCAADVMALRGVLEPVEQDVTEEQRMVLVKALLADFDRAVKALDEMRKNEGERLSVVLAEQLAQIADLAEMAKSNAASRPQAIRERLQMQLNEILGDASELTEERMAQEVAVLVTKADIREEIDRLVAHEAAARGYLKDSGAVGRKLDFLCQEFNREANTLCSKSTDVGLTQIGLDLKSFIERFREQIQNIE